MGAATQRVAHGEVQIANLSGLASLRTQQTPPGGVSALTATDQSDHGPFLARLEAAERAMRSGLARLEAAERAMRSGLGLTTAEVTWILGARPDSREAVRGGIRTTRTGWNC